jgi:hypothetical protein
LSCLRSTEQAEDQANHDHSRKQKPRCHVSLSFQKVVYRAVRFMGGPEVIVNEPQIPL